MHALLSGVSAALHAVASSPVSVDNNSYGELVCDWNCSTDILVGALRPCLAICALTFSALFGCPAGRWMLLC